MCSLFKNADLQVSQANNLQKPGAITVNQQAAAQRFDSDAEFLAASELKLIEKAIGKLLPGKSIWFKTDGAWSNYHLLEYILGITGAAEVCFTTWSISEVAITKFLSWKADGRITDLFAVIDVGLRNRKPAIYHQAIAAFPNLKVAHCHAKATVVISAEHHITFIGSSNYTRNPRKEVGVIIWDENIARANQAYIKEEVYGSD
jgi:hypothetical protein